MDNVTSAAFDALEDAIEDTSIPFAAVLVTYARLLAQFVDEGRFVQIADVDLHALRPYLDERLVAKAQGDPALRSRLHGEIVDFSIANKERPGRELTACMRFLYADEEEFERYAQDPLVFYCFYFLKKIVGDVEPEFLAFFNRALFPA